MDTLTTWIRPAFKEPPIYPKAQKPEEISAESALASKIYHQTQASPLISDADAESF
jgi:hypothetical protein